MTSTTATPAATTPVAAVTPAAPKAPSKKSLAVAIFAAAMAKRTAGGFASNKDFRAEILNKIVVDLGVSVASAATMYNSCKKEAEVADAAVALGRDPKKVKVKVEGAKRGRPAKAKTEAAPADTTVVVVTEPAAEAAPEAATA